MPNIRTDHQPVTQITVIEAELEKQREVLSLMTGLARHEARPLGHQ